MVSKVISRIYVTVFLSEESKTLMNVAEPV